MKTNHEKTVERIQFELRKILQKLDEAIRLGNEALNPITIKVVIPKEDK